MPDPNGKRDWLDAAERETSAPGLPRSDLNPLLNPLLGQHMGRWAQVYFTTPAEHREQAVEKLLHELQAEAAGKAVVRPKAAAPAPPSLVPESSTAAVPAVQAQSDSAQGELPMPQFNAIKDKAPETAPPPALICPACLHKNAAEQRFCGLCGTSLTQKAAALSTPVPAPTTRAASDSKDAESDWQWLRQRSFANFEAMQETKSGSRLLLAAVVVLIIAIGGYFAWRHRSQSPSEAPKASTVTPPPVGMDLPMANKNTNVASAPALPDHTAPNISTTKDASPSPEAASKSVRPVREKASSVPAPQRPLAASPSGNGQDELQQARSYLNGRGVPRNSWMASQWLWKAVAKHNTDASLLLSDLYARGDGVPRNCEQARILLVASAKKGSALAAQKLREIENSCR